MKKIAFLVSILMVLVVTTGALASWVDGTYEAWSDASARSVNYAKVFVADGQLTGVILREFTDRLVEKDWAVYSWEASREAAQVLSGAFVANQGVDVDMVTGATSSSSGYIQAVERALTKAAGEHSENEFFDGVFIGRSEVAGRNYYEVVWVTLEDDTILDIQFQRVLSDHSVLDLDEYSYPLEQAQDAYRNAAVSQAFSPVDTITGATRSTGMWNRAVMDALDRARTR